MCNFRICQVVRILLTTSCISLDFIMTLHDTKSCNMSVFSRDVPIRSHDRKSGPITCFQTRSESDVTSRSGLGYIYSHYFLTHQYLCGFTLHALVSSAGAVRMVSRSRTRAFCFHTGSVCHARLNRGLCRLQTEYSIMDKLALLFFVFKYI